MWAVIRIRGTIGIKKEIVDTLKMLNLDATNNCVIIPESGTYKGMLQKVRELCTWGQVDAQTLAELMKKKLRKNGDKADEASLKQANHTFESLAAVLIDGKAHLKDMQFEKVFRLRPPSKGFESTRNFYPKGDLGNRGKDINDLLKRMM